MQCGQAGTTAVKRKAALNALDQPWWEMSAVMHGTAYVAMAAERDAVDREEALPSGFGGRG